MDLALLTGLRRGDLLPLEKRHLTDAGIDSDGFRTIWDRLMRRAAETRAMEGRCTFHDIRAKSLSDDTAAAATVRSGRSDLR
jgi:hypothetical protein